ASRRPLVLRARAFGKYGRVSLSRLALSRRWRVRTHSLAGRWPGDGGNNIRVRSYPVRDQDGLIWIYMAAAGRETAPPRGEPPRVNVPNVRPRWVESQSFACGIDHAVIGLMDPAHAPYVHGRWWWRVRPREKVKHYAPLQSGFVMTR